MQDHRAMGTQGYGDMGTQDIVVGAKAMGTWGHGATELWAHGTMGTQGHEDTGT